MRFLRIFAVAIGTTLGLGLPEVSAQTVIYVDSSATSGANDGTSWPDAFLHLQDGLAAVIGNSEIWVAQGTYKPDQGVGQTSGDRLAFFGLVNSTAIYGGFPSGGGDGTFAARDYVAFETVLSGDLAGDDGQDFANNDENSFNVVLSGFTVVTALLDGFTITGGTALCTPLPCTGPFRRGGGLQCTFGSPTIANCIFRENISDTGGAISIEGNSDPAIINCMFIGNASRFSGGSAMRSSGNSSPRVFDCAFIGNHQMGVTSTGGAVFNFGNDNPSYTNCLFSGNIDRSHGGGLHNLGADAVLTNCTFVENSSYGGASTGGGLFNSSTSTLTIDNCIFWNNSDIGGLDESAQIAGSGTVNINYSCVFDWSGSLGGTGNFGDDPLFIDADGPDDTVGTEDDNPRLFSGSPCIDAGDNLAVPLGVTTDLDGNARFFDDPDTTDTGNGTAPIVDIGAYEYDPNLIVSKIVYVDQTATGGADNGTDWPNAFLNLQDALAVAMGGDEIWVAQGTYKPDQGVGQTPGDRSVSFNLIDNVSIYGGFPSGGGDGTFAARDYVAFETILSGDLAGNDGPDFANNDENSFNVVESVSMSASALLDGFTISGGAALCEPLPCNFLRGGGLWNRGGSDPTIVNCTFRGNIADNGGAINNESSSAPTIINCMFIGNASRFSGSAMESTGNTSPQVRDCTFIGNSHPTGSRATVFNFGSNNASYTNCLFSGNIGTGMRNHGAIGTVLTNCTFVGNSTHDPIFSYAGGLDNSSGTEITVNNCIFWNNSDRGTVNESAQIAGGGTVNINYSCVFDWSGVFGGTGNFGDDPLFIDADGPDDTVGTEDDNPRLFSGSPCVDAGDNLAVPVGVTTDLDGNARFFDDLDTTDMGNGTAPIVDIGAYEFDPNLIGPKTIYVDQTATGGANDGTDWPNAYLDLQDALDDAAPGDQIWVAAGVYLPSAETDVGDPRSATIQLANGVAIYGGFSGVEIELHERNPAANPTTLSGDLAGDDPTGGLSFEENAYHIVNGSGTDATAVLDGFVITAANADGGSLGREGGGFFNDAGSPTVRNCKFIDNHADLCGGGALNKNGAAPVFLNCEFVANDSISGGGMEVINSAPTLINCTFVGNSQGIRLTGAGTVITNCILWQNGAESLSSQINPSFNAMVTYSCIQGWPTPGVDGNIDSNPMFVDAPMGPFERERDVRLLPGSPCHDAGNNAALPADEHDLDGDGDVTEPVPIDVDGRLRFADDICAADTGVDLPAVPEIVDMGAHEFVAPLPAPAVARLYVDPNSAPGGDGTSWADAFTDLQDALNLGNHYPCVVDEIWVAAGTYKPTSGLDRAATFKLSSGVAVYGGFAGDEMNLADRDPDPATNGTVLSGDIGTPDDNSDNSYTVVTGTQTDNSAVLDGFTITRGNSDGSTTIASVVGGGVYTRLGSPTLRNCFISDNTALRGGGMYNTDYSHPILESCVFQNNSVPDLLLASAGAIYCEAISGPMARHCRFINNTAPNTLGGAMFIRGAGSNAIFEDCLFQGNSAGRGGAALFDLSASPAFVNCRFVDNTASTTIPNPTPPGAIGGALVFIGGTPVLINCVFEGNSSPSFAGAVLMTLTTASLTNCVFSQNTADLGGALVSGEDLVTLTNCSFSMNDATSNGGGFYILGGSTVTMSNCILWNNTDTGGASTDDSAQIFDDPSEGANTINVEYSCVHDADPDDAVIYAGVGNIDDDPLFVDAANHDLALISNSPCIDAGDNTSLPSDTFDLDGDIDTAEPTPFDVTGANRFNDDPTTPDTGNPNGMNPLVDMGAHEFTPVPVFLLGDLNCDGAVDGLDIGPFAQALIDPSAYATTFSFCNIDHADVNEDTLLDLDDLTRLVDILLGPDVSMTFTTYPNGEDDTNDKEFRTSNLFTDFPSSWFVVWQPVEFVTDVEIISVKTVVGQGGFNPDLPNPSEVSVRIVDTEDAAKDFNPNGENGPNYEGHEIYSLIDPSPLAEDFVPFGSSQGNMNFEYGMETPGAFLPAGTYWFSFLWTDAFLVNGEYGPIVVEETLPPGELSAIQVREAGFTEVGRTAIMITFNAFDVSQLGDLNCDGTVNVDDVGPFTEALIAPNSYQASFSDCDIDLADLNEDGLKDGRDIAMFLSALIE